MCRLSAPDWQSRSWTRFSWVVVGMFGPELFGQSFGGGQPPFEPCPAGEDGRQPRVDDPGQLLGQVGSRLTHLGLAFGQRRIGLAQVPGDHGPCCREGRGVAGDGLKEGFLLEGVEQGVAHGGHRCLSRNVPDQCDLAEAVSMGNYLLNPSLSVKRTSSPSATA